MNKEQRKSATGPSGVRPVLQELSLTQTSCNRSFKSTMGIDGFPQLPAQHHDAQNQLMSNAPFLAADLFASASHNMTQSFQLYTARLTGTQLSLQQSASVPHVKAPEHLPYQLCLPFPGPTEKIPQQQVASSRFVQQTAATSQVEHCPAKAVKPDFSQLPDAGSRHLTDEFPFSFSIAKELPHIFGNLDDEVQDRPLTPSFEPLTESEPWWEMEESLALYRQN